MVFCRPPVLNSPIGIQVVMKRILLKSLGIVLLLWFIVDVLMHIMVSTLAVPSFEQVSQQTPSSFIQILDRHGEPLETVRADFQQRRLAWLPLSNYSQTVQALVLLSEDKRFFQHQGVDWFALLNAARNVALGGKVRGASTISMQVVGMIVPELQRQQGVRSYRQKLQQILYAQALELKWSKEQILEAYLNMVPLRGEVVGIRAGAQTFFQKYPSALNQRESALLVAMLRAPNAQPDVLIRRVCDLLQLSWREGHVSLQTKPQCDYLESFVYNALSYPHQYLLDTPQEAPHLAVQLVKAYQHQHLALAENLPSTIDKALQRFVQQRVQSRLIDLFQEKVSDAAVVVLDNKTGEVLAYVGSSGRLSAAKHVDHASALRQAGSTLKPFLYAQALGQKRLTAASLLNDDVLSLDVGSGLYVPQNYDREFKGWVSVRTALASSLNIPAVKTLTMLDIEGFRDTLVRLGLPLTEAGDYYGYSLALGSADVSLLSLTNAYRALANLGVYSPVRWITAEKVSQQTAVVTTGLPPNQSNHTHNAEQLNAWKSQMRQAKPVRIFTPESSWIIGDILSDRYARVPTFGADSALSTPFWTAVKTGTSKDMRDNWTVGWSSRYTVGVWVGNSAGESMRNISGVSGAAPIWHDVMMYLHKNVASVAPVKPDSIITVPIHYSPLIEPGRQEHFLAGTQMQVIRLVSDNTQPMSLMSVISTPTDGTIFAFDPDIPHERQQLKLEARQLNQQLSESIYWTINGEKIGEANPLYWPLRAGKFTLELFSQEGKKLDTIHFQVR